MLSTNMIFMSMSKLLTCERFVLVFSSVITNIQDLSLISVKFKNCHSQETPGYTFQMCQILCLDKFLGQFLYLKFQPWDTKRGKEICTSVIHVCPKAWLKITKLCPCLFYFPGHFESLALFSKMGQALHQSNKQEQEVFSQFINGTTIK